MSWDQIVNYVDPKLIVAIVALYFVGMGLKSTEKLDNKFIPIILGGIGIIMASIFIFATGTFATWQDVMMGVFNAIVQGIIIGSVPVWVDQNIKQLGSKG